MSTGMQSNDQQQQASKPGYGSPVFTEEDLNKYTQHPAASDVIVPAAKKLKHKKHDNLAQKKSQQAQVMRAKADKLDMKAKKHAKQADELAPQHTPFDLAKLQSDARNSAPQQQQLPANKKSGHVEQPSGAFGMSLTDDYRAGVRTRKPDRTLNLAGEYDESLHPRDEGGRWSSSNALAATEEAGRASRVDKHPDYAKTDTRLTNEAQRAVQHYDQGDLEGAKKIHESLAAGHAVRAGRLAGIGKSDATDLDLPGHGAAAGAHLIAYETHMNAAKGIVKQMRAAQGSTAEGAASEAEHDDAAKYHHDAASKIEDSGDNSPDANKLVDLHNTAAKAHSDAAANHGSVGTAGAGARGLGTGEHAAQQDSANEASEHAQGASKAANKAQASYTPKYHVEVTQMGRTYTPRGATSGVQGKLTGHLTEAQIRANHENTAKRGSGESVHIKSLDDRQAEVDAMKPDKYKSNLSDTPYLDAAKVKPMQGYKFGHELHPDDRKQVLASYVHRYTGEHVPGWAKAGRPDGSNYMPQHATDADWLKSTQFKVKANGRLDARAKSSIGNPEFPYGQHESEGKLPAGIKEKLGDEKSQKFHELQEGDKFEFHRPGMEHAGLASGPWIKTGTRSYKHAETGMKSTVGSKHVAVRKLQEPKSMSLRETLELANENIDTETDLVDTSGNKNTDTDPIHPKLKGAGGTWSMSPDNTTTMQASVPEDDAKAMVRRLRSHPDVQAVLLPGGDGQVQCCVSAFSQSGRTHTEKTFSDAGAKWPCDTEADDVSDQRYADDVSG